MKRDMKPKGRQKKGAEYPTRSADQAGILGFGTRNGVFPQHGDFMSMASPKIMDESVNYLA